MERLPWLQWMLIILASYRFTHLIVFDKITEFIRRPFIKRERITGRNGEPNVKKVPTSMFGYLLNCYWCAGMWSAAIIVVFYSFLPRVAFPVILILASAGAAAILETFVGVGTKCID